MDTTISLKLAVVDPVLPIKDEAKDADHDIQLDYVGTVH